MMRSGAVIVAVVIIGAGAVYAYRSHQADRRVEADAPVIAPSRLSEVEGAAVVKLDSAGMANAALRLAILKRGTEQDGVELRGIVVADPDAVTTVRAPVAGRLSSYQWPKFGDHLDAGSDLGSVSDAQPLKLPRGGTVTQVFARVGAIVQAGDPLLEVTDYARPLVSVAWSAEAPATQPAHLTVRAAESGPARSALLIGPAAQADPVTHQPAFLYRLDQAWSSARPGLLVSARVATGAATDRGVMIPAAAVVQWDGLQWAWLRRGDGTFERQRVSTSHPTRDGWLVGQPWKAGDSVVVAGAEQLLSEEFRARVSVGDEVAE